MCSVLLFLPTMPPSSLPPSPLGSGWKEAASPLLSSPLPLQARKEATQVGKKIIGGMAHGSSLERGGGGAECTIHLEYFLPEGEKGRPHRSPPRLLRLPTRQPARRQRSHRCEAAWSVGPSTPRSSQRSFNFESRGFFFPFLFQLSFRSFVFPPAHHYLRRCPDRQTGARAASA